MITTQRVGGFRESLAYFVIWASPSGQGVASIASTPVSVSRRQTTTQPFLFVQSKPSFNLVLTRVGADEPTPCGHCRLHPAGESFGQRNHLFSRKYSAFIWVSPRIVASTLSSPAAWDEGLTGRSTLPAGKAAAMPRLGASLRQDDGKEGRKGGVFGESIRQGGRVMAAMPRGKYRLSCKSRRSLFSVATITKPRLTLRFSKTTSLCTLWPLW